MFGIRCGVLVGVAAALLCVESVADAGPDSPQSTPQPPSAVGAASDGPLLRFEDAPVHVRRSNVVYLPSDSWHNDDLNIGLHYFDQVDVEDNRADRSQDLEFAVDRQPDYSTYQVCDRASECRDVRIGARRGSGLLYLETDHLRDISHGVRWPLMDYPGQRAELSVEDAATGLKAYREVFVAPPADAPDCSAYPEMDAERYTCLFLGEQLPPSLPDTPAELRDALPNLVQPKENYHLILAEEFDHPIDTSGGCSNGMTHLGSVWSYDTDPCNDTGARGVPCFNVTDGHFYFSKTSRCQGSLDSDTKFEFKYGYTEVKYIVDLDSPNSYQNLAFVLWSGGKAMPLKYRVADYGITPASYEDISRYLGVEVDLFEYIPYNRMDIYHQYINADRSVRLASVEPRRSWKASRYCKSAWAHYFGFWPRGGCGSGARATVTKGIEWTPRGYRTFLKVDGVHTDFIVVGQDNNQLQYWKARREPDGSVTFPDFFQSYPRQRQSDFFEYLVSGDNDSILENFSVAHLPASLSMDAWGYPTRGDNYVRTKMRLDYIRVFKPANGYRDMEPVYE